MLQRDEGETREIIAEMLDGVEQEAPDFKHDLRALVIERCGDRDAADTAEGRRKLPGEGNYARAFLDALEGFEMPHVADWYDELSWDDEVLCDKMSVARFLGPLEDEDPDRVEIGYMQPPERQE